MQRRAYQTLSVIGVGVMGVHVPGALSDDFFYTDRVEIECADCRVQRIDALQQQPAVSVNKPLLKLKIILFDTTCNLYLN